MRTVVIEPPEELRSWLERRQALGQDRFDEVWEGVLHVAPAPHPAPADIDHQLARILGPRAEAVGLRGFGPLNVGVQGDYRVPDGAYLAQRPTQTFVPTVTIAVEVRSPSDETWDKLAFYFAQGVEELLVVDPMARSVQWHTRGSVSLQPVASSRLLSLSASELTAAIDWPPTV